MYFIIVENYLYECSDCGDTEVTLPDEVVDIGVRAFAGNSTIRRVKLHNSVRLLNEECFEGCSALEDIELPDCISKISKRSFANCTSLESVKLPRYLGTVESEVFSGCTALRAVELSEGITEIKNRAFAQCTSLESIQLPESICSIDEWAFWHCSSLREIVLPPAISKIDNNVFGGCTALQRVVLPKGLKDISPYAFNGCSSLSEIDLPEGVEMIYGNAFCGCSALKEVKLPFSLKKTPEKAFPSGVLLYYPYTGADISDWTAGKKYYALCGFIRQYMMDESSVSDEALASYCSYIRRRRSALLPQLNKHETAVSFLLKTGIYKLEEINELIDNAESTELKARLLQYKQEHFTPEDELRLMKRELERDPFSAAEMKKLWSYTKESDGTLTLTRLKQLVDTIIIPSRIGRSRVTRIDHGACNFSRETLVWCNWDGPTKLMIPEGIISIGDDAFAGCIKLKDITIPDGVESMGKYTFCHCYSIETIQLPDTIKTIENGCFENCASLKRIELPKKLRYLSARLFSVCYKLEEICINEGAEYILSDAFEKCTSLKSLTIPASVKMVYKGAFEGCTGLDELIIKGRDTELEDGAVERTDTLVIYAPEGSSAQRYAAENGISFRVICG